MIAKITKSKYSLAMYISLLNGSLGILAIYFTHINKYAIAALLLIAAVVTDGLDGFCARHFHSVSDFGKEVDSLCDLVSFGIAPGFFVTCLYPNIWVILGMIIFISSGVIRLAKFNVTEFDGYFRGTPITLNGIVIPLVYWLYPLLLPYFMVILAITMNLPIKWKKVFFKKSNRKTGIPAK